MEKFFNINGVCKPDLHYMVDISSRLDEIKAMVDAGKYFTINRARQYGKTTTLRALADYLKDIYVVVNLDFQRMSHSDFAEESAFVSGFAREVSRKVRRLESVPGEIRERLAELAGQRNADVRMANLFDCFNEWCDQSEKPVILIVDEADTASNNQVFIDFLAQLRAGYLDSDETPIFQSVILAGVYDVRSIKRKIRTEDGRGENSPWNIAADFEVDMSFSVQDIAGMLEEYEADHHAGMDVNQISALIYDYTAGYPYLVSKLCKLIDEKISGSEEFPSKGSAWTKAGFFEAEKIIAKEDNTLYQSLIDKLNNYDRLRAVLYELLFTGKPIPYAATNDYIKDAAMFGFIKNENDTAVISNRIFESVLYNFFISEEFADSRIYNAAVQEKNRFIVGGHLDIRRILEKFVETFDYLYGERDETFLEDAGRRYFLLFLNPVISGVGSYSIEPRTRNNERMDIVIYYRGEQNILELKIWRGNAYNERGEEQLSGYLDYFNMKKGYMLSFNFNRKKEIGVKDIDIGDKLIVEAVV